MQVYISANSYTMGRTNVVIDDELLKQVFELTEVKTKREAVDLGLRELVRKAAQSKRSFVK